jgi:lauroyl/myristoyl acyltransferase
MRQPDDTHCVYFEKPLVKGNMQDPKADFQHFVTQFVRLIETYIRREPTQWAWME